MHDIAILGSGPGGYVAALRAAMRGAKVAIVEKNVLGGTCLNVGCIPTKTMLHASELYWHIRHAKDFGFAIESHSYDTEKFMKRTERVVRGLRSGVGTLLKHRNVDIFEGHGKLTANDTIEVEKDGKTTQVQAKTIIIATGSQPVRPGFLPWDSDRIMTTDEATTTRAMPESILIMGGGVIGSEFATVYSELGIETTLVEMLDRLVAVVDEDVSAAITKSLKDRDVKILTSSKVTAMKPGRDAIVTEIEGGNPIETEKVLVAVGRRPNIENIGLETVGVETENGIIKVDECCRTNVPNIYAVGDVAEKMQYAHLASRMGVVAADHATEHEAKDDRTVVPVGIYTHPEAATVGLSETQAREQYEKVKVASFPYQVSGMAKAYGETEGQVKLIAEEDFGRILGGVVIGQHATDVIQEIAVAMRNELTVDEIAETIHPHPTFVEAVGEAAEAWLGLPLHSM